MSDVLDLPFDQYQRYGLVAALLSSVRAEGERFHVLDVGGRTALLRDFLPNDQVDLVDVDPSNVEGLILGSGAQLPFKDNSFDVVAAFDTLEHVPPELRGAFVSECGRVAKRYVMLAGPYHTPRVAEAEQYLLDFLKVKLNWEHRYLAEHRENGLPDAVQTRSILRATGAKVEAFGHGALDRWLLLMMLELYVEHEGLLHGIAKGLYRFYNEHLFSTDHGPEVYRHAIVAAFDGAPMPTLEEALDPPGSAPRELTGRMIEMGAELLRYDSLRDTYLPEMERLHAAVAEATKNAGESSATVETFKTDLVGHKETIEALRTELTDANTNAEAIAASGEEQIGGLTSDLAGHKDMIAEISKLREAELAELEVRGTQLGEIRTEFTRLSKEFLDIRELAQSALPPSEDPNSIGLGDEVRLLISARDEASSAKDEALAAKNEALAMQSESEAQTARVSEELAKTQALLNEASTLLSEERERADLLAADARHPWNRAVRKFTRRKLDKGLMEERGPVQLG